MSDAFGWNDIAKVIGMGDGRRSEPDEREKAFLAAIQKQNQPPQAPGAPASGVATGGPVMAAPGGGPAGALPQMPAGVGANPLQAVLAQRQLQGQPGMQPQMGGVMGMQLVPPR